MKTIIASIAAVLIGTSAFAGGMSEPVEMAPVEIIEDTTGSSGGGLIVPLILVALIAAAVSSGD